MKKIIQLFFIGCFLIPFLVISQHSSAQIQIVPIEFQSRNFPDNVFINLKSSLISDEQNDETSVQITPGNWIADTGTGFAFEFIVNEDASGITKFKLIFTNWTCGFVTHNGGVTITSNWNISNNEFNCSLTLGIYPVEKFTLSGRFTENGNLADGNWSYESDYGNCSGTWTAAPEGGVVELPDLILTSVDFSPEWGTVGTILNVNAAVKNNGSGAAGESVLQFFLSGNDIISESDEKIGEIELPAISAGANVNENISWTIPASLAEGWYFVGCIIDTENQINETNETNNNFRSEYQFEMIKQELPELVAVAGGFQPLEASTGDVLNVNVTIKNIGLANADTSTVAFFLCKDPNVSVTDILMGTASISALDVEEEKAVEIMYEITDALEVGTYFIGYQLDYYNSVEEIENDNYYYLPDFPFTRLPDPDLVISNVTFNPTIGKSGENLNVDVVIKNKGDGNSNQFKVNFYLSLDSNLSESDYLIGSSSVSGLASKQETSVGINWFIQSELPDGNYYVGCKVDAESQVTEIFEDNNIYFSYPGQFTKDDPPQIIALSPNGVLTTTKDSKPELKITFSESIQEGEGCLQIFQELPDGSEKLVRDKQCWEGLIVGDTMKFRLSLSLDRFAVHYVLIEPGFVKDLNDNPFEGITEKSAWVFKTGNFPTGVFDDTSNKNARVFPNPTSGELNIELINIKAPYFFDLINITGQVVVQQKFYSTNEQIDLCGLAKGIYMLKVYNHDFSKTEKLIIK